MPTLSRRSFLVTAGAALGATQLSTRAGTTLPVAELVSPAPVVVSTWPFGKASNDKALQLLTSGASGLDAVEKGINVTEGDPTNHWVGLSGYPNAEGFTQLDACIMSGPGHQAGSVAALEGFRYPISVARRVMETTKHVMLVGNGAMSFAAKHGFERGPKVSPQMQKEWREWKKETERPQKSHKPGHDTIALVLLAPDGNLYGGCSTSGLKYKTYGRVGDSPIIGSGLYVDNEIGAAGATGTGENVMRYCGSFMVVEYIRQGLHPQEACVETLKRIARMDPKGFKLDINFLAVDRQGRFGAAGLSPDYEYSVACKKFSQVLQPVILPS